MASGAGFDVNPVWHVWRFALHTTIGVVLFALVAGATYLLNWGTGLLSTTTVSPTIIYAVQGLELFLFAADFICLVAFVIKETWIFLHEIMR